jgi:hypothetical protein
VSDAAKSDSSPSANNDRVVFTVTSYLATSCRIVSWSRCERHDHH